MPVVLIHGFGFDAPVWTPLAECLSADYTIRRPSLPGYGDAPEQTGPLGGTFLGEWSEAHWVGWSMGGLLALDAIRLGCVPRSLTLIASQPCMVAREDWPHAIPRAAFRDFRQRLHCDPAEAMRHFAMLAAHGDAHAAQARRQLDRIATPGRKTLEQGLDLLEQGDLRSVWAAQATPQQAILGARDALLPEAAAESLKALCPSAAVTLVPDAGHAVLLSHAARCADLLRSFHQALP